MGWNGIVMSDLDFGPETVGQRSRTLFLFVPRAL